MAWLASEVLLLIYLLLLQSTLPRIMADGIGTDISTFAPTSPEDARSRSRADSALRPFEEQVFKAFHPGKAEFNRSVKLAIKFRHRWLFVDQHGAAKYGGQIGKFDVVAWESLLRREPSLRSIRRSILVRFQIDNRSARLLTLNDEMGFLRATVPAQSARIVETWLSPHNIRLDGKVVGWISTGFDAAFAARQASDVVVWFKDNGFYKDIGPNESRPTGSAEMVVSEP